MKILVLNNPSPAEEFARFLDEGQLDIRAGLAERGLAAAADAVINGAAACGIGPVEQYPNCRIVVRMGVGYDNLDLAAWGALGVPVCNVPDYGTTEVADHAIALMLSLVRGTALYAPAIVADPVRGWDYSAAPLVRRLRGATFGVLGLGRIGLAAALRARGFGMEIVFHDPYVAPGIELSLGARRVHSVAALMAESDVVSVHTPLNDETRGIIGTAAFAAAKPGLVLVNTARGPLVDIDALQEALRDGLIGGAALDVLAQEPPDPEHPLIRALVEGAPWTRGRLVLTPHAAFYSPAGVEDLRRKSVEVVIAWLRDGKLTNCVNREMLRRN
jgi:D-3-phosphoglycerate dehydrogenase/C-terminal binding protein